MNIPLVRSLEEASYEARLSESIGRLHEEKSVLTDLLLTLWCGTDRISDKWLARPATSIGP